KLHIPEQVDLRYLPKPDLLFQLIAVANLDDISRFTYAHSLRVQIQGPQILARRDQLAHRSRRRRVHVLEQRHLHCTAVFKPERARVGHSSHREGRYLPRSSVGTWGCRLEAQESVCCSPLLSPVQ